jgi:hypothetical protein
MVVSSPSDDSRPIPLRTIDRVADEHPEHAHAALEALERSLHELGALDWIESGQTDDRWDCPQKRMLVGR